MPTLSKKDAKQKNKIIALFRKGDTESALSEVTSARKIAPNNHEFFYLEGMILGSRSNYADAFRALARATELNPKHGESFFEIAYLQMALCRFNLAEANFKKALTLNFNKKECSTYIARIRSVAKTKDVTLSACLIVKNEEKFLPGCLKSLETIADEIVIVDTGSTDETIQIAEEFGAKIFHYKWKNDFADARNFANSNATGDWIIQLDADEELFPEDQNKVREIIHQGTSNGAYLALHNRVSNSFGENMPSIHYLVRLFRNSPEFYYENAIHEVLQISGHVAAVDVNILHHGYNQDAEYMKTKRNRNAEILYRRLEEDPEKVSTLFYLSMMHVGCREFDKAESFALKAIEKIDPGNPSKQHLLLMMLNNLALIKNIAGDLDTVIEYSERAISINENFLDPYFFLGTAYYRKDELSKAKDVYSRYLKKTQELKERPVFNLFGSSADTYLFQVYHFLGKIHRKEHDDKQAEFFIQKSVELNPKFWIGYVDLAYINKDCENLRKSAEYFEKAINLAKENPDINKEDSLLYFDFVNAAKSYMQVLKMIGHQNKEAVS